MARFFVVGRHDLSKFIIQSSECIITSYRMPDFSDGLLWYLVFLYSTVCHEAAHAWSALKLGDDGWGEKGRLATYAGAGVGLITKVRSAQEIVNEVQEGANSLLKA